MQNSPSQGNNVYDVLLIGQAVNFDSLIIDSCIAQRRKNLGDVTSAAYQNGHGPSTPRVSHKFHNFSCFRSPIVIDEPVTLGRLGSYVAFGPRRTELNSAFRHVIA